ncbi:MAG: serine hydrolase [Pyrinomonadaceae bacterium]|nr:serine hydrolase [Pyrinomonadaceae bacterium]
MKRFILILCMIFAAVLESNINAQDVSPLQQRANEVAAQFGAAQTDYAKLFAPSFLGKVAPAQLNAIFSQYFTQFGRCTNAKLVKSDGANSGSFELTFEKNFSVSMNLVIDADAPNLITGLLLRNPTKLSASLEEIVEELKKLHGVTSLYVAKLDAAKITPIISHNAVSQMPLGSSFKLYVLAELVRQTNAKQRRWQDVVNLRDEYKSLPSGMLQDWGTNSPVTLNTLASLMISISDNTATDNLLMNLGRENVEKVTTLTGTASQRNQPFMTTGELFKLKWNVDKTLPEKFTALDAAGKRAFLANVIDKMPLDKVKFDDKISYNDKIEWFATTEEMCRLMNWLRLQSETDKTARDIMAINDGSIISRERWQYVGYKGGGEPGVLTMNYLLQSKNGDWYAFSAAWNDANKSLEEKVFFALVGRIFKLIL